MQNVEIPIRYGCRELHFICKPVACHCQKRNEDAFKSMKHCKNAIGYTKCKNLYSFSIHSFIFRHSVSCFRKNLIVI